MSSSFIWRHWATLKFLIHKQSIVGLLCGHNRVGNNAVRQCVRILRTLLLFRASALCAVGSGCFSFCITRGAAQESSRVYLVCFLAMRACDFHREAIHRRETSPRVSRSNMSTPRLRACSRPTTTASSLSAWVERHCTSSPSNSQRDTHHFGFARSLVLSCQTSICFCIWAQNKPSAGLCKKKDKKFSGQFIEVYDDFSK
jgi:hypothetical protein